jgi:hypothetical protein
LEGAPSFERDIKPLFRDKDQRAMDFAFDLWNYEDVRDNAKDILEEVAAGKMPCDERWPAEKVALFRSWTELGMSA